MGFVVCLGFKRRCLVLVRKYVVYRTYASALVRYEWAFLNMIYKGGQCRIRQLRRIKANSRIDACWDVLMRTEADKGVLKLRNKRVHHAESNLSMGLFVY